MKKTPFLDSLLREENVNLNGQVVPVGYWNLVLSIRDLKLFCGGIKPHRRWKLSDVKIYFGLSGSKEKILSQLIEMQKMYNEPNN